VADDNGAVVHGRLDEEDVLQQLGVPPEEETEDKPRRTLAEILGLNRKGDKDDVGMDV